MIDAIVGAELLAGALGVMGGVGALLERQLRRHDPLVDVSRTAIAEAKGGPVKIVGTLKIVGEPLRAPFSGLTCAYWDVTISQAGGEEGGTLDIFYKRMTSDFLVDDGTGPALVKCPPNALLDFAIRGNAPAWDLRNLPAQLDWFLSTYGYTPGLVHGRPSTYRERALVSGEQVAVYGHGHREPDPDLAASGGTYRERPTRLVVEPLDSRLRLSNYPSVVGRQ